MQRWVLPVTITAVVMSLWWGAGIVPTGERSYALNRKASSDGCPPIPNTPYFTIAYGTVLVDGMNAPAGTIVEAVSPRGDVVGCFEVSTSGHYGAMYIYGEDASAEPPIPGMRDGEEVSFYVDGVEATAVPVLIWHDDHELHEVNLTASSPTPTPAAPTPTPTRADTPTPTATPTALPDLIVQDILAEPESPVPNQAILVTVTIRNQGSGPADRFFYTDVYADHTPDGCGDAGWDYARIDALEPDGVVSLAFTYAGFIEAGIHSFYAYVDSACQVEESNETNNVYGPLRVQVVNPTPPAPPPVADFVASPTAGAAPLQVQFTDLSSGQVDAWLWDFGDGFTGTLQNPLHTYTLSGTFTVSLTVRGPGGSDIEVKGEYIRVTGVYKVYLPLVLKR